MKSLKNIVSILFFLLPFSFWLTGCGDLESDQINIGVIIPMTGELASYGEPMKIGIDMALEELNSREKAPTYRLTFIDSKADQTTAVSGLQQLINVNKVQFVIGDVSSSTTLAMVPVAEQNEVFLLSPGASSPRLIGISDYFARNYPSSVEESVASAEFVFNELGFEEAALIHVNNEYGLGLSEMFEKTYTDLGGTLIMKESYAFEQTDFRTLVSKIRSINPELIYLAGNQREMGNFMRQFDEAGLSATIVSNISFLEPDCLNIAGPAANGVIVPLPYYNPEDLEMRGAYEFGELYHEKHGNYPSIAVAVGYDALMLMAKGIEEKGQSPAEVAAYIRNLKNYDGAMGELNFTDGDVSIPVVFKVVENGEPVDYEVR